jgi:hypothetical protein
MVKIGESAEESGGSSRLVSNDHSPLARTFDFKDFDDGAVSIFDTGHDRLVDIERIFRGFFQKGLVGYASNQGVAGIVFLRGIFWEDTSGDEVTTQLLSCGCADGSCGTEGLESVCFRGCGFVEEEVIDS